MIVTIHQPEYLPYLGFFDRIDKSDVFVVLDTVKYQKNGFMNRNRIKGSDGAKWVTIPVRGEDQSKTIHEVRITESGDWKRKHWAIIKTDYERAPYFKEYAFLFEEAILKRDWKLIADLDFYFIKIVLDILGIRKTIVKSSDLDVMGKGAELLISICKKLGADTYISGPGNEKYHPPEEEFKKHGITVMFHRFSHPEYPQLFPEKGFLPYASVIDLIFNCGPKALEVVRSTNS